MQVDDMVLISIDDHLIEPPNVFENHVPAAFKDQAPRMVRDENGKDQWIFEDQEMGMVGLNAVVSWPKEQWGMNPSALAEMRPGAYDIHERVRDMNRNGVLASMCFPSMAGFSGRTFQEAKDKDLSLVMLKAYNDWHIDEWCAAYPGRFLPQAILPLWDLDATVEELHRVAAKGALAVSMPELPHTQGYPSYHSETWDPFFTAMCDLDLVMSLHIGQGLNAINLPDINFDEYMVLSTQVTVLAVQDLLWGHALRQFPGLKIAFSEGGIGWLPFLLDRIDRHYQNQRWTGQDFGSKLPSEVLREHSLACFIADPTSLKLYQDIGIDMIAFETDYPHSDCLWPNAPEDLLAQCVGAGCSDEDIDQISWKNVARFCNWDPFAAIPRQQATVGALRAQSPDVETGIVSREEWRARYEANPPYAAVPA